MDGAVISRGAQCAGLAVYLAWSGCGKDTVTVTGTEVPGGGHVLHGSGGNPFGSGGSNTPSGGSSAAGSGGGSAGGAGGFGAAGSSGAPADAGTVSEADGGDGRNAVLSAGCGQAPQFQSGTHELDVDDELRTFILDLPADYAPSRPYPLLFGFHGRDFTAAQFRAPSYGNLLSAAGGEAVVVHPDATLELWAWDLETPRDLVFFDAMLEVLTRGLCIDQARVFATGHSSGGYFSNVLGCQRGNVLRAIAPLAGGGPFAPDGGAPACERPVSALIAHAEDDEIVPFSKGEDSLAYWLASDACTPDSFRSINADPCVAYEGCGSGLAVRSCVYTGGHAWPSFAARAIWDFFKTF